MDDVGSVDEYEIAEDDEAGTHGVRSELSAIRFSGDTASSKDADRSRQERRERTERQQAKKTQRQREGAKFLLDLRGSIEVDRAREEEREKRREEREVARHEQLLTAIAAMSTVIADAIKANGGVRGEGHDEP